MSSTWGPILIRIEQNDRRSSFGLCDSVGVFRTRPDEGELAQVCVHAAGHDEPHFNGGAGEHRLSWRDIDPASVVSRNDV
jgi:hypothetical protein